MGRGLSKLQRSILKLAAKKNPATYRDILVHYFKWKILPVGRRVKKKKCWPAGWRTVTCWRADGYEDAPRWFDEEAKPAWPPLFSWAD
jgi:hypothetical protein